MVAIQLNVLSNMPSVKRHPHNDPVRREHRLSPFTGKKTEHVAIKSLQDHFTSEGENMAKIYLDLKNIHLHFVRLAILYCSGLYTL